MSRKSLNRKSSSGIVVAGAAVVAVLSGGSASVAASSGPIVDIHSLGPLTLYGHNGKVLTSGNVNASISSEVAKATAPGPAPVGYRDGVLLSIWTPVDGSDPSQWDGDAMQGKVDDAISKANATKPLVATHFADNNWTLAIKAGGGTSKGDYANVYQLRLQGILYGPTLSPQYYTATIKVNPANGNWTLVGGSGAASGGSGSVVVPVAGGIGGAVVLAGAGFWWLRRRRNEPSSVPAGLAPADVQDSDLTTVH